MQIFKKLRYDNKKFEDEATISIEEAGKAFLIKMKGSKLTSDDKCELEVKKEYPIITRDLPKNAGEEVDGIPFEPETYFIYKLSNREVKQLGSGRFKVTLRFYNSVESIIIFEQNLKIQ